MMLGYKRDGKNCSGLTCGCRQVGRKTNGQTGRIRAVRRSDRQAGRHIDKQTSAGVDADKYVERATGRTVRKKM